jgi:hypothetical protein
LSLLGRHSTIWSMPPAPFCFHYFSSKFSLFCPGPALDLNSPANA